jgi:hypothetical protein
MAVTHARSKDKQPPKGGSGGGTGSGSDSGAGSRTGNPPTGHEDWPPQVELILSAIEAGRHGGDQGMSSPQMFGQDRRRTKRASYRVRGRLRLFSDAPGEEGRVIYTRDIHARGLGFITPHRLPLGHGGVVELPTPNGKIVSVPCTLLRCREAAPGWYEGSVYFNREQSQIVPRSAS